MILSNIISSATSLSTSESGKLSEAAKILAPGVRVALLGLRREDEFCLDCSTVLVGVGVILEVFEIVHELREKVGAYKFHHAPMAKWMVWAGFAGWLMIVGGVAGEWKFEGAVSTWNEELDSLSNALLRDAQVTAADAINRASEADETTTQYEGQIADSKREAARATETAARESLERQKLEVLVSPRRLTIDEQRDIGKACKNLYSYGATKRIKIRSYGLDGEGAALAFQIEAGLNSAPLYTEQDIAGIIVAGGFDTGVIIAAPPEDEKFANCLKSALTNIGRLTSVNVNPERHAPGAAMNGASLNGGTISGPTKITPAAPLPAGSAVEIFVGIKPIQTVQMANATK
jgi:hypothetical protein